MQRVIMKQVLFLILLAVAVVMVMGIVICTNVNAQGLGLDLFQDWDWDDDWDDWDRGSRVSPVFRYNRVEGLYLGFRVNKEYWRRRYSSRPFLFGFSGYAFKVKELQYQIGVEKGFFDEYQLAFGGEYHRMIDTPDRWMISDMENSLAAFLIKEDFHDFYMREGGSAYLKQNFTRDITLSAAYHYDNLDSLERNAGWSLFGGKKEFRENPPMASGEIRSVVGKLVINTRNSEKRTTRGWYIQIEGEHAGNELGGDFEFDRLLVDVRRYQPLGFGEGFDLRLRAGTSQGELPWQRTYHLGGLSTLRGFSYKAFPHGPMDAGGNRMILAQLEYRMGSQDLPDELDWGLLERFNLILFVDAGWVGFTDIENGFFEGFESLTWSKLKSDVGIAFASRSGNIRFQIARRTDTNKKPYVFSFRINRPF